MRKTLLCGTAAILVLLLAGCVENPNQAIDHAPLALLLPSAKEVSDASHHPVQLAAAPQSITTDVPSSPDVNGMDNCQASLASWLAGNVSIVELERFKTADGLAIAAERFPTANAANDFMQVVSSVETKCVGKPGSGVSSATATGATGFTSKGTTVFYVRRDRVIVFVQTQGGANNSVRSYVGAVKKHLNSVT